MSFWNRLRARTSSLLSGSSWMSYSGMSAAGERVTYDKVMQIGAAYACAKKLTESVSSLPFHMFDISDPQVVKAAPDHALAAVLGKRPNADQTPQKFWEVVFLQLVLRGNHYSLRIMDGERLIGLEPLPAHGQTVCRRRDDGAREFVVSAGAREGVYAEDEIFFVPGFGEDPDCGMTPIALARNTFGRLWALETHQSKMFKNGVRPSVVFETEKVLTEEQRAMFEKNIIEPFVSGDTVGGATLLEHGFKANPITLSPADLELLETGKFGVEEVCRWFGVPPWLIGHTSGDSNWGTGLEQQMRAFAMITLDPLIKRVMSEVTRQLMTIADGKKFEPRMPLDALYEGDSKTRAENDERLVRGGIKTPNEVRGERGLPPIEGGNVLRMQQQMIPLKLAGDEA